MDYVNKCVYDRVNTLIRDNKKLTETIDIMRAANKSLSKENQKLKEVLKFYADKDNWDGEDSLVSIEINCTDWETIYFENKKGQIYERVYGGERAREVLR